MDCLFCKIIAREIPATFVYQDKQVVVINDIDPKAPQHKLIIPQKHIATLNDLRDEDTLLVGHLVQVAKNLAEDLAINQMGYRLVMNCNREGGQAVFHIHLHLLGGRPMHWPPG
jgi:histidine triad (HIT) family protein